VVGQGEGAWEGDDTHPTALLADAGGQAGGRERQPSRKKNKTTGELSELLLGPDGSTLSVNGGGS